MRHSIAAMAFIGRASCVAAFMLFAAEATAAENIEAVTNGGGVISHKFWSKNAFPLKWKLSSSGVVNNEGAAISNADAASEVDGAIQSFADVGFAGISATYDGETPETASGCDLINLVTWSDDPAVFSSTDIVARSVTTSYIGAELVLTDANRTSITCRDGATVTLPEDIYPIGSTLESGAILDMDMTFNSSDFDFVLTPNATAGVVDIAAVATHEFGHMMGISHSSLTYPNLDPVTMFPEIRSTNVVFQTNLASLNADDETAAGFTYPSSGFWPGGTTPYTSGAIAGRISTTGGNGASGIRIWAYSTSDITRPVYETLSATEFDWNPDLEKGDYLMSGMEPGEYYLCIIPWDNGVHSDSTDSAFSYNRTTANGDGNTGFPTKCYDDIASASATPDLSTHADLIRTVSVQDGKTVSGVDFTAKPQATDFVLVMDRSGSMGLDSGISGKSKIQALQDAAHAFIDYLDLAGGHRIGLVQFQEDVVSFAPAFDLQDLNAASVTSAHAAVDTMYVGGSTNISSGIHQGISQLTDIAAPNGRQIMLLFSDGKHNRPVGSNLADIKDDVVDNDVTLYSVGFGTDVDDAVLSDIALETFGLHVNEQDLDPLSLAKYFLSVAASAANLTTLADPGYSLIAGATSKFSLTVGPDEKKLVVAVNWITRKEDQVAVTVITPGGCKLKTSAGAPGIQARSGQTYHIAEVPLPMECNGKKESVGEWAVAVTGAADISRRTPEDVNVVVFGKSDSDLIVSSAVIDKKPALVAKMVNKGHILAKGVTISAELLSPAKSTGNSAEEDKSGDKGGPSTKAKPAKENRAFFARMYDDGTHGDEKASDGIFVGPVRTNDIAGLYRVRLKGTYTTPKVTFRKEAVTSFYFDGKGYEVTPVKETPKIHYVD